MTQDGINLSIYRRKSRLFVAPGVLTLRGFQDIKLIAVAEDRDGLLHALETAEQLALELTAAKPRDKRVVGQPKLDWSVAGVASWSKFVSSGTTQVGVLRMGDKSELVYWVPDGEGGLIGTILKQKLKGKVPLTKIAAAVIAMFERADREKPRIETVDDLDDE